MTAPDEASMVNDQKDGAGASVPVREPTPETNQHAPRPRHPLFGALRGYMRVMPRTDLTQPADPAWGNGDRES
jgi:hypothetical protein